MRKGILYILPILSVLLTVFFTSCDDDDDPVLKVSVSTLELESDETVRTFTITSNVGWVISSDQDWCTFSPQYGSGDATVTVTLSGINEDMKNSRNSLLTIQSGQTGTQEIKITQAAKPSLPTSAKEAEIVFEHGTVMDKYGYWYYFSFEEGKVIGFSEINAITDEAWKTRTDWDIAFSTFYAKTNSGVSGNGAGGVFKIENEEQATAIIFKELVIAPEEGYTTDELVEKMMIKMPPSGENLYTGGGSEVINSCLVVTGANNVNLTPTVFAIRTASGKYAKIYIKEWESRTSLNAIVFEYAYQPDGTTNLNTQEEE